MAKKKTKVLKVQIDPHQGLAAIASTLVVEGYRLVRIERTGSEGKLTYREN